MAKKGLPASIQNQRNAPVQRIADNIINPVNQMLSYLSNQQIYNYVRMGYLNASIAANTWTALTIDGTDTAYYIQDADTYLLNTQLVVNGGTATTTGVQFRLYGVTEQAAIWTSSAILKGVVVLGGNINYGQVKLAAGQVYYIQVLQTAGTGVVAASASLKVSY